MRFPKSVPLFGGKPDPLSSSADTADWKSLYPHQAALDAFWRLPRSFRLVLRGYGPGWLLYPNERNARGSDGHLVPFWPASWGRESWGYLPASEGDVADALESVLRQNGVLSRTHPSPAVWTDNIGAVILIDGREIRALYPEPVLGAPDRLVAALELAAAFHTNGDTPISPFDVIG